MTLPIPEDGMLLSLWHGLIPATCPKFRSGYTITRGVLADALRRVQDQTGITPSQVLSGRRRTPIVRARHLAMFMLRQETDDTGFPKYSYPEIGRKLGQLDHTTVIHGVRRHMQRMNPEAQRIAAE